MKEATVLPSSHAKSAASSTLCHTVANRGQSARHVPADI